jgi:glycosyltransferase involved in cell wall biosynthesis
MRILAVPSSYGVSAPITGGQSRFAQLVRMQTANGNKVIVFEADSYRNHEDSQVAEVHYFREPQFSGKRMTVFRDANLPLEWQLSALVKRTAPDIVEFEHPSGMTLCRILAGFRERRPVFVYAAQNVESDFSDETYGSDSSHGSFRKRLNTFYASFLEKLVCGYVADHVTSISTKDRARFIEKYGLRQSEVTAINPACAIPTELSQEARTRMREGFGIRPEAVVVVFVGSRSHLPNVEAASAIEELIAPAVIAKDRRAQFVIAGSGFPIVARKNVNYVGYVERIQHLLLSSDIAIAPIERGAGVKMKVIEYMAAGLAIVSTRKGTEGIDATDGEHAVVVDHVDDRFAEAVLELVRSPERRARLGRSARELAIAQHDWDRIGKELSALYARLVREASLA